MPASPTPEGPGSSDLVRSCAFTSSGNPVSQLMIGYKLQPFVKRLGPLAQASAKGRSQLPLKEMRCRTSKSEDARNRFRWKNGICELRFRNPEELSIECAQV